VEKAYYLRSSDAGTSANSPHTDMAKRLREDSTSSTDDEFKNDAPPRSRSHSVEADGHTPKYASLEPEESTSTAMRCLLPPHKPVNFKTYQEYEAHYQQAHTNRCKSCRKNFPTAHFLDLHLAEHHDPIIASKRDAGEKTYACFVEGCDKVCSEWKKRRSHLVDKHGFPKNYDFLVVDHGIDGRRSMLRPGVDADGHRKSSRERARSGSATTEATQTTEATSVGESSPSKAEDAVEKGVEIEGKKSEADGGKTANASKDVGIDELTSEMSTLKMVPRTVTFGKRKGRSGFAKS
jgi:hypothetical protein